MRCTENLLLGEFCLSRECPCLRELCSCACWDEDEETESEETDCNDCQHFNAEGVGRCTSNENWYCGECTNFERKSRNEKI